MAVAKCVNIAIQSNGTRIVSFDDGSALEFENLEALAAYGNEIDTADNCKRFLLARYVRTDPDGSDTAALLNRTASINPGAPNPVQIG